MARADGPAHYRRAEDPGLQPERTTLSWGRTVLAMALVASLFLRWAGTLGPLAPLMATGCSLVAVHIYHRQRRRHGRAVAGIIGGRLRADAWGVTLLTGSVVLLSLGGAWAVATGP